MQAMRTYHVCPITDIFNKTYTTDCPTTGETECTSQADTIGSSCSQKTLRACVLAQGSASCNTNRLASSHPTSHRPEINLVGVVANGCPSLILMLETSRKGRVVHDHANCADCTSIRSRNERDCEGDGPGGRGKGESVYKSFQSISLQAMVRNHFETCRAKCTTCVVNGRQSYRSPSDNILRIGAVQDLENKFCGKYSHRKYLRIKA